MINDLILKDTTKEEWLSIREKIKARIIKNLGISPAPLEPKKAEFKELERYEEYGLTHIKIKYHMFDDVWGDAIIILPRNIEEQGKAHAVITIHGSNDLGKYSIMNPKKSPNRTYALELAERGYVTISPDQIGFGEAMNTEDGKKRFDDFYKNYPDWSLTGCRLYSHMRTLDVLDSLDYVIKDGYGVIGNSLGGQASFYLAGIDERIKAAVVSTGISPFATNAYRLVYKDNPIHPYEAAMLEKNGKSPWELNEMVGLCAPRAVLFLEPFNDPYNPYASVTFDCVRSGFKVYDLLGSPKNLSIYLHGDGHDTIPDVRDLAYDWIDRFLK